MPKDQQLTVWKDAMALGKRVLLLTDEFPSRRRWTLGNQMDRSAISVASNISEGARSKSDRRYANHIRIAIASAAELRTQFLLAESIGIPIPKPTKRLLYQVDHKLEALHKSLQPAEK